MKTTKRFVALLMAVVMVFALSAVALAATGGAGVHYDSGNPIPGFSVKKAIYLKNNTDGTYSVPKMTFKFRIEPATGDELNYDAHAGGVAVFSGLPFGLVSDEKKDTDGLPVTETEAERASTDADEKASTFEWTVLAKNEEFSADPGKKFINNIYLNCDPSVYNAVPEANRRAGVYRYKVTDITDEEELVKVGVVRPTGFANSDDACFFVDLYVMVDPATRQCKVGSIVTSEISNNVPDRDDSTGRIIVEGDSGATYDPSEVYVDDSGNIYKQTDLSNTNPVFPDDYSTTAETYKAKMVKGLEKTDEPYCEDPVTDYKDENGDGKPDLTTNGVPEDLDKFDVVRDDEGNVFDKDGNVIPNSTVNPATGEILQDEDGDGTYETSTGKYAKYTPKYEYKTDLYTSYNVAVKKFISGDLADPLHKFPFVITINNVTGEDTTQTLLQYCYVDKGAEVKTVASTTTSQSTELADKEVYIVRGLNPWATVNYQETNNTTFTYSVKAIDSKSTVYNRGNAEGNQIKKIYDSDKVVRTYDPTNKVFKDEGMSLTKVFNTQVLISPTGVVLRFAPYILMLGAAVFFVALSRRRREQENA